MTKRKLSPRRAEALAAQKAKERKQMLQFGGAAALVLIILAGLVWLGNRPKVVEVQVPEGADGMAWGPADAPVVIREFSDFN